MNEHQLADKGWQQMSAVLDKEMPQPRKKRPVAWWFTAAILAGLVYNWYHQPNSSSSASTMAPQPTNTTAGFLEANVESSAGGLQQALHQTETAINAATSPSVKQEAAASHKNTNFTPKSIGYFHVGVAPLPFTPTAQPENGAFASEQVLPNSTTTGEPTHAVAPHNPQPAIGLHSVNILAQRQPDLSYAASLPLLEKVPDAIRKTATTVKKVAKKHPHSKVNFGLMVGAQAFQVKQVPGFIGGLSIDFNTRSRKLGLQSGIVYRYQEFSGESRPVIPVSYDHYIDATGIDIQPENFPNSWLYLNANKSILVPVLKSHQVEVPALLYWQPHHRFRLYGGVTVLRHVWIESAEKALFTYDQQVVYTPDDKAAGNLNNVITGQLPAWEKNWQTGISFKPVKYLEVGLFYRATWKGKPLLSDAAKLFDTCTNCTAEFPAAEQRTNQSLRPQSLQLTATIKF